MRRIGRITAALALGAGLAAPSAASASAPYMGVDSWYGYRANINERTVVVMADAAARDGLERAGYRIVWFDAGWWTGARHRDGSFRIDPTLWPHGIAWLIKYLHSKGFRAGMYEVAGHAACYNGGAGNHVRQDVNTFAAWGVDALKVDYCGELGLPLAARPSPLDVYSQWAQAIAKDRPHRPILLNAACADDSAPGSMSNLDAWQWGPASGAQSWRTETDLTWPLGEPLWSHLLRNIDANAAHPRANGDGHGDPDYLMPMLFPFGQAQAQFTMWAMMASPLLVSADIPHLSPAELGMVSNRQAIAIDQDRLGVMARSIKRVGQVQVWVKPLSDGSKAVALLNRGTHAQRVKVTPRMLGLRSRLMVHEVWTGASWRARKKGIILTVAPTSARLLRVRGRAR